VQKKKKLKNNTSLDYLNLFVFNSFIGFCFVLLVGTVT